MSKFLLVDWVNEYPRQFSVVSTSFIEDGTRRQEGRKLIGQVLNILWKGKPCEAKIIDVGSEMKLLAQERELAEAECQAEEVEEEATSSKRNKRHITEVSAANSTSHTKRVKVNRQETEISNVLDLMEQNEVNEIIEAGENSDEWKSKYEELHQRWTLASSDRSKYKRKWRNRKAAYKVLEEKYNHLLQKDLQVELLPGSGVFMKQSEISTLRIMSTSAPVFARNLFRSLFAPEEIQHHSLGAKKCNANRDRFIPLPPVDAIRRDAIIGFVLSSFGGSIETLDANWSSEAIRNHVKKCRSLKREVKKSLSDFLREETRKLTKVVL